MKLLSQNLAELAVQAKRAEDRVAQAQSDVKERLAEQRENVRQETKQALDKVNERFNEAKGETRIRLNALKAKVDADFENVKQQASQSRDKFEAWQAENYASDKEADALAAIDYAIVATKIAELQTLDAIAARAEAQARSEQTRQAAPITA